MLTISNWASIAAVHNRHTATHLSADLRQIIKIILFVFNHSYTLLILSRGGRQSYYSSCSNVFRNLNFIFNTLTYDSSETDALLTSDFFFLFNLSDGSRLLSCSLTRNRYFSDFTMVCFFMQLSEKWQVLKNLSHKKKETNKHLSQLDTSKIINKPLMLNTRIFILSIQFTSTRASEAFYSRERLNCQNQTNFSQQRAHHF